MISKSVEKFFWKNNFLTDFTFVSIDSLQVHNMSDYMVLIRNTVSAQHISSSSGDVQCFPAIITFQNRDHLWSQFASILELEKE